MKYDIDLFTYANIKYGEPNTKESKLDKLNKFGEKVFIKIFTMNGYGEKICNKLMELFTGGTK